MRFAVLSHLLPPSATGQPVMLARLLSGVAAEIYCLIGLQGFHTPESGVSATRALPAACHHLPRESRLRGAGRARLPMLDWHFRLRQRSRSLARVLKLEGAEAVVACSGDLLNIPAAFLAARRLGVRVIAYYFDDYPLQWLTGAERRFASAWERRLIAAGGVFVAPNELLRDEVSRRGAKRTAIVRNPLPDDVAADAASAPWPAPGKGMNIVFAGAIYHAHADAFRNLLTAMEIVADLQPRLRIFTAQPEADLRALGLVGGRVDRLGHLPEREAQQALREADVLFLPLAFASPISEVIRTSSPGKLADYLASGRPVLVHAPADSFSVWYAKRNECAWVADRPDPQLLAAVLRQIAADPVRRRRIASHGVACARRDFAPALARQALLDAVGVR